MKVYASGETCHPTLRPVTLGPTIAGARVWPASRRNGWACPGSSYWWVGS